MKLLESCMAVEIPRIEAFLVQEIRRLKAFAGEIAEHAILKGGKRLRPLLTILFAGAHGYRNDKVYPLAGALEFLHSATLLHDDILDDADIRRGRSSAHVVFGGHRTILAGDVLFALANRIVAGYGDPRLVDCLADAIIETADGEILEIASIRDPNLSRAAYLEIITGKTAYLIQAACKSGALLAGASGEQASAASGFGLNLGIAFQLIDDALDYSIGPQATGKPNGNDLAEGKMTLPLIYYRKTLGSAEREAFDDDFRNDRLDAEGAQRTIHGVVQGGCLEKTRRLAKRYADEAGRHLISMPDVRETDILMEILAHAAERNR